MANSPESKPRVMPTDVASAVAAAVCELGMPPVPTNHLKLNLFSLNTPSATFMVCAISHAAAEVQNMLFFEKSSR